MACDIFISHAVKDKPLVEALVEMLRLGTGISHERIFCCSLDGMDIPIGINFVEFIKREVQETTVVIALLSPQFMASKFCLLELGATWALNHNVIPLIVPPLGYADVGSLLPGLQAVRIDNARGLSAVRDQLCRLLDISAPAGMWEAYRDQFLKKSKRLIKKQASLKSVTDEHTKLLGDLVDANAKNQNLLAELAALDERCHGLVAELAEAKDLKFFHDRTERLKELKSLEWILEYVLFKVPPCVVTVAFCELTDYRPVVFDCFGDDYMKREIREAIEKRVLKVDHDSLVTLNRDDPSVDRIVARYEDLKRFVDASPDEFKREYENDFGIRLDPTLRSYWERTLNLNMTSDA